MGLSEKFEGMGYRFHGQGSVSICRWTKYALKGQDVCYKQKFYGVPTHRCMELAPCTFTCSNNCVYCWRPQEFMTELESDDGNPIEMVESLIEKRYDLLTGFKGNPEVNQEKFREAIKPIHFAISLAGEPTEYPKLQELISYLLKREGTFSVFLVTNGQNPESLRLDPLPTQIYLSMTAPSRETYKRVSVPQNDDFWTRFLQSCDVLASVPTRTVARITLIKGVNMTNPEGWYEIIRRSNAHFVEFKGFSLLGYSRNRLKLENVPRMEEIRNFAQNVMDTPAYREMDTDERSRIVVYKNTDRTTGRWIKP